jgi:hypothetical protein
VSYFDPIDETEYSCFNYKVTITFRDEYGHLCESQPAPNAEDPSIDWAEVCDTWSISEIVENKNLALYPNPTTGLLTIAMDGFSHAEVYDLMGRKIKQSQRPTLDLHALTQGLYVVKVFDKTGNSRIRKVIKN